MLPEEISMRLQVKPVVTNPMTTLLGGQHTGSSFTVGGRESNRWANFSHALTCFQKRKHDETRSDDSLLGCLTLLGTTIVIVVC